MSKQKRVPLSHSELEEELDALPGWELADGRIRKRFEFENFIDAFAFMTTLALVSERINHHPEWTNVYNVVDIALVTHDVDAVSNLDIELARAADMYFGDDSEDEEDDDEEEETED